MFKLLSVFIFILSYLSFSFNNNAYANDNVKLPEKITTFIQKYCPNSKVTNIEKDVDGLNVLLSDGSKISFDNRNEWISIKCGLVININIIPKVVVNSFKKNFPKDKVVMIKKSWCGFIIFTNLNNEIYLDKNGMILGSINNNVK